MRKTIKYISAYGLWFVDLGLATWLLLIARSALMAVPALIFNPETFEYPKRAEVTDKVFVLLLGIGWLAFMVITQEYYSSGLKKGDLVKRFARLTGPLLLCIFVVDSILFWIQGNGANNWLRLLIIIAELVVGLILVIFARIKAESPG